MDNSTRSVSSQEAALVSEELHERLLTFIAPLLIRLDEQLDKRLVRTFVRLMEAVIMLRHRGVGLLLSELGAYVLTASQAPAGTKRISNLVRSKRWRADVISQFLWQEADGEVQRLTAAEETVLAVWDESAWEKPESIAGEGLCAVRSRKAARLKRIRPGFYRPPTGKVFVPGLNWLAVMVVGMHSLPKVAQMRWWTSRGPRASTGRQQEAALLQECHQAWHGQVLHLFDRGFAGGPWLCQLALIPVRFVVRWKPEYQLQDATGHRQRPGAFVMRKRSWEQRDLWDFRRHDWRTTGVLAVQVYHDAYPGPLWLVVARQQGRSQPWYLLTNEPAATCEQAWRIVFAYQRRWQVEWAFRYHKTELAIETLRVHAWDNRLKLLLLVSLVYAFLLSLAAPALLELRQWLLRHWCHRTGRHVQEARNPLYRIRSAISRLWLAHSPPPVVLQNPG